MYRTLAHDSAHVMLVEQNVSSQVASQILGKLRPQEQRALDRVPAVSAKAYDLFVRGQGARDIWNFGRAADYFRQPRASHGRTRRHTRSSPSPMPKSCTAASTRRSPPASSSSCAARRAMRSRSTRRRACRGAPKLSLGSRRGGRPPCGDGRTSVRSRPIRATPRRSRTTGSRSFARVTRKPDARCSRARSASSRDALNQSPRWRASPSPTTTTAAPARCSTRRSSATCCSPRRGRSAPSCARATATSDSPGPTPRPRRSSGRGTSARARARWSTCSPATRRARDRLNIEWTEVKSAGAVGVLDGTSIARALLAAGQTGRALDILELAMPRGPWLLAALRDPAFDSIRNDKRFRAITSGQ